MFLKNEKELPLVNTKQIISKDGSSHANSVVGHIGEWIDVDSSVPDVRSKSESAFLQNLRYAGYMSFPAVTYCVKNGNISNLARLVVSFIDQEVAYTRYWFIFPLGNNTSENPQKADSCFKEVLNVQADPKDVWSWWITLSALTSDVYENVSAALILCENMPSDPQIIDNWISEPVSCLYIPTSLFTKNSKGYPVLPKAHQAIIKRFFNSKIQVVLTGPCYDERGYTIYRQYMYWLHKNRDPGELPVTDYSKGFEDALQEQLQPLKDHLTSATYEVFETDPYKYKAYEDAIANALEDRANGKTRSPISSPSSANTTDGEYKPLFSPNSNSKSPKSPKNKSDGDNKIPKQIVMVLGAGRGPLVQATFEASKRTKVPVKVYIVEKNPSAVFTLKERLLNEWSKEDAVLLSGDMRDQRPDDLADIFVSELLGSFGDNELSPECLDGAQIYLKSDGISIPYSYTSYLSPIQSAKVYNETRKHKDGHGSLRIYVPRETPYVACLTTAKRLSPPQNCFTFVHPKKNEKESNGRHIQLSFPMKADGICHGFGGYFHSVLYGDITMSIHPKHHSPGMFSWFPLYFPIDKPISVKRGDIITVDLWRIVTPKQIWYEWAVTSPIPTKIHNSGGKAYSIGMY